jgi:hypothetical protein
MGVVDFAENWIVEAKWVSCLARRGIEEAQSGTRDNGQRARGEASRQALAEQSATSRILLDGYYLPAQPLHTRKHGEVPGEEIRRHRGRLTFCLPRVDRPSGIRPRRRIVLFLPQKWCQSVRFLFASENGPPSSAGRRVESSRDVR